MDFLPNLLPNLDLLSVGVAIAGTIVLGFAVYFADRVSVTNRTFLWFSLITALWGVLNYLSYKVSNLDIALLFLRLEVFFAVWHTLLIFQLFYVFPENRLNFPKKYITIIVPIATLTSLLCLTPLVFSGIKETTAEGFIKTLNVGPGMVLFAVFILSFTLAGFYSLVKKIKDADSIQERKSLIIFFFGGLSMFLPILFFIFVLPAFLEDSRFIPLAAVFIFPFVLFTSYAILKHKLFNIKVAGTGLLVFALSITTFGEIIIAKELYIVISRSIVFILILFFGILLIKGVLREVEQREKIELLAKDLEEANKQQENLIHFITHQIKGFLTKSRYIFAELLEGSFGPISDDVRKITSEGLKVNTDGVTTVQTILNAANIKTGKMKYDLKMIDFKDIVGKAFEKHKENAESKDLKYTLEVAPGVTYGIEGDSIQLSEAVSNLIDNSIKYTLEGSVKVSLSKRENLIRLSVKDTGIGISPKDREKLFTEGGRGQNSQKVNVDSTGFGLYIVKNIVEAHHGKVWVESEGEGKGSEFIIEIPGK